MTFQLAYSEVLQGAFEPGKLNLMMVFQPNCPGCFMQGFPQMISLHRKYRDRISFFGLSTAFEDFEFNTIDNTRLFLENSMLTGETKKAFDAHHLTWSEAIPFPVLYDRLMSKTEMLQPAFIDHVISSHARFSEDKPSELANMKASLHHYFSHYEKCGFTFATNFLQGTPTFVLFNQNRHILLRWFGHAKSQAIEQELDTFISIAQKNE